MFTQPQQFPPDRRADPRRLAEARVFDAIQSSDRPGLAIYEWQRNPGSPQLDFAIWTQGGGRFGLQVKGGQISLDNGKWYLETHDGPEEKPSPLCLTWDAAMSLREDIIDILGDTCCFVIAVLLFPDMEPDPAIVAAARRSSVKVLWGTDNLMNRLAEFAARKAYYPPNAEDIRRETAAVTDGQVRYAEEGPDQGHREEPHLPPEQPEAARGPQAGGPGRRHHHRARGYPDCPHRARRDAGGSQGPGTRELVPGPGPCTTTGGCLPGTAAGLRTHTESRGSGRNNFTIQHNQTFQEEET